MKDWEYRFVLTGIPIEVDGILYKVRVVAHPDSIKAMIGIKMLELEEIPRKGKTNPKVGNEKSKANPIGAV